TISAYISAGVAARRLSHPRWQLTAGIKEREREAELWLKEASGDAGAAKPEVSEFQPGEGEISHHALFALARRWARSGRGKFIDAAVRLLEDLRKEVPHVLEIAEELVLAYLE